MRGLQRNIDLDSKFKPMMLMPGMAPPIDENEAADFGAGSRADDGALTAAYSNPSPDPNPGPDPNYSPNPRAIALTLALTLT